MKLKTSLPYVLILLAGLILAAGSVAFASSGTSSPDKTETATKKPARKKTSSKKASSAKDAESSGKTASSKTKAAARTGKASTAGKASSSSKKAASSTHQGKSAAKAPAEASDAKSAAQSGRKVVIKDVQVYSGQDYSRIVLVLSGQTERHWQLLPADASPDGVRRLYVDLDNAIIRSGVPSRFDVHGDAARKVRLSYFKPDVARTVIEVENLKSYNVFELENPYRVVVDVQGEASAKKAGPAAEGKTAEKADKSKSAGKSVGKGAGAPAGSKDEDKPGLPGVNLSTPAHKKMARQLVEQLGLTVRTVMVDAGHGGKDPGARGVGGLREKDVTLRVARLLGERLSRMGFNVLYTRTTDKYVPLEVRTAMANANKADLFLSVHCNAHGDPGSTGLETYSLNLASTANDVRVAARENSVDPGRISDMQKILDDLMHASKLSESCDFAKAVHASTLAEERKCLDQKDRGVHEAPFYVLLGARMPAVLVEIGYVTNPREAAKLRDEKYLESLAKGIAGGVEDYKNRIERYARK